ncbi:MAG TPA: preprotein translocase subunit SecY [Streptosporangiaceae bacterium]|nr:preprotein translocase subunit SecY [Streptosporangiaceae bacterium]
MLTAFYQAFRTPDLRKKLLFTLFIIVIFRLGASLPTPGVSEAAVHGCISSASGKTSIVDLVNLLSGGALLKLTVFALGIMPYITASIILQLLAVVIPRLEALRKEGPSGTAKITQYTRYLTIGLAILQSTAIVALAENPSELFGTTSANCPSSLLVNEKVFTLATMVICLTAGTAVIMWLGELITDRGVGNGMSLMIFTQVIAVVPGQLYTILQNEHAFIFILVLGVGVLIVAAVAFMEQAQRRVPVQYAKRMVGRKMYGGSSTYIPLKVNQAGVIPVIFASSLLTIPVLAANLFGHQSSSGAESGWAGWIDNNLIRGDNAIYMLSFFVLIILFTYFYVSITFNPDEVADNMKKSGGFIPGIRPGGPTAGYLRYVLNRLTAPGSLYLGVVALIPMLAIALVKAGNQFPLGGTSIMIAVGVGLDTVKQIESQLQQRNYEGFLR